MITTARAQRLAQEWRDWSATPQDDAFQIFASTGQIDTDGILEALCEIELAFEMHPPTDRHRGELTDLLDYFTAHAPA